MSFLSKGPSSEAAGGGPAGRPWALLGTGPGNVCEPSLAFDNLDRGMKMCR